MEDFYSYFDIAKSVDKLSNDDILVINNHYGVNKKYEGKKALFDEYIITMMKKYQRGYDKFYSSASGFDFIHHYLNGNIDGVTRNNNLRNRVSGNLDINDVYQIIRDSGLTGTIHDIDNYIRIVMLNEIIRCSEIKFSNDGQSQVQEYIDSGNNIYITNSVGHARVLTYSLSSDEIKKLFADLGVRNIEEYMRNYYNINDNMKRGR